MRTTLSLVARMGLCAMLAFYSGGAARADDDASLHELEKIKADWGAWKDLRRELAASYVTNADKIRAVFGASFGLGATVGTCGQVPEART